MLIAREVNSQRKIQKFEKQSQGTAGRKDVLFVWFLRKEQEIQSI